MAAQMRSSHAAGVVHVGEAALDEFTSLAHECFAPSAPDALAVGVHSALLVSLALPFPSAPFGLGNEGAQVALLV